MGFSHVKFDSDAVINCDGYRFAGVHFGHESFQDFDGLHQDLATSARDFRFDLYDCSLVIVDLELGSTGFRIPRPYAFQQDAFCDPHLVFDASPLHALLSFGFLAPTGEQVRSDGPHHFVFVADEPMRGARIE